EREGRTLVGAATLPADDQVETEDQKSARRNAPKIVGALTLGDFIVSQKTMAQFAEAGMPKGPFRLAKVKSLFGPRGRLFSPLVMLDEKQLRELKAVPTF